MAGQDIYLSFGAETGKLEAAMARRKAEVAARSREMRQTAAEMQKSGADMDSALSQSLSELGQKFVPDLQQPSKCRSRGCDDAMAACRDGSECWSSKSTAWYPQGCSVL